MAEGKKSFIAYSDWKATFDELSDEDAGRLIKHIFAYVNDENPATDNVLIRVAFAQFKQTLKRDLVKWNEQLQQRRAAGKRSAEKRALEKSNERSTVVESRQRNSTDSVSVSVSVSDNVNENEDEDDNVGRNFPLDPEIEKRIGLNSLKPLNEVFNELDNNQQWKEAICMNHSIKGSTAEIKLNNLQKLLNEFYNHLSGDMQIKEKSLQDTYSHFSNWLRKKKEYERK